MIRRLILLCFAGYLSVHCFSQTKLGEVASIYITSPDLESTTTYFEKFGFKKIASNNFPAPWSQSTDGSLLLMMRQDTAQYVGLTYYSADVESVANKLEQDGIKFIRKPKDGDPIKRYVLRSPDGLNIMIVSNPGSFTQPHGSTLLTMKQEDLQREDKYPNKQCGVFGEFCHPVHDLDKSIDYWKKLGFELKSKMSSPYPMAILSDGLMLIGLHQTDHFSYPAISFFGNGTDKRVQQLREAGVRNIKNLDGGNNFVVETPEGLHLFLFSFGM